MDRDRSIVGAGGQSICGAVGDMEVAMGEAGFAPATRAVYRRELERFLESVPGGAEPTVGMAKGHIAELRRQGRSRSLTGNASAALRFFFERVQGQEWNRVSPLRLRMIEDMCLHSFSPRTQQSYVRSVLALADYYGRSPDRISEEEIRRYFVHLTRERKLARATITIALCGIKFFYTTTLKRDWSLTGVPVPKREKKVPVVLSPTEVDRILERVRVLRHRACLTLAYGCGLRLQEACRVRLTDIDRGRGLLHVSGKGSRERYVPLPRSIEPLLIACWRSHRNPVWMFPWVGRGARQGLSSESPVPKGSVQQAFRKAYLASAVKKKASVHSLRHAYATHLLEAGVDLRQIQEWLGHRSPATTAIYAHLTERSTQACAQTVEQLMSRLARPTD